MCCEDSHRPAWWQVVFFRQDATHRVLRAMLADQTARRVPFPGAPVVPFRYPDDPITWRNRNAMVIDRPAPSVEVRVLTTEVRALPVSRETGSVEEEDWTLPALVDLWSSTYGHRCVNDD